MLLSITSKLQVTFPAHVLASSGAKPGGRIELTPSPHGFILRAKVLDASRLAPLQGSLGEIKQPFDVHAFRDQSYAAALRD